MIDNKIVSEALKEQIGFRNSNDPNDPVLDYVLTKTESGLYVNDVHELINTKNMNYLLINYDTDIEDFDILLTYLKDEKCLSNNVFFKAIQETTGNTPENGIFWDGSATNGEIIFYNQKTYTVINDTTENPDKNPTNFTLINSSWTPISQQKSLSDELKTFVEGASNDLMSDLISDKAVNRETKPLLDTFILYTDVAHITSKELKQDRRVGFEVNLRDTRGLLFALKSIRTQFDGIVNFDIQIHTPNSLEPLFSINIDHSKISSYEVTKLAETIMLGVDKETNEIAGNSTFFISYLENSLPLPVNAIKRTLKFLDRSALRCSRCPSDVKNWANASPYFNLTPFYLLASDIPTNENELWDIEKMVYVEDTNFGLNFSCSIICNETNVIIENLAEFSPALQWHTAYKILEAFGFSTRVSGLGDEIKSSIKSKAQFDTNSENSQWLKNYNMIRQGLRETFKNLDFPCFTPPIRYGITKKIL